jgi:uncharacterized membrane protein
MTFTQYRNSARSTPVKRYQWSVALAVVGGILATKTAAIGLVAVLEGGAIGAAVGFILGWLLDRRNPSSGRHPG